MINKEKESKNGNDNKNKVNIYNNFRLSIHFGDSLNLLALITGLFLIKNMAKRCKTKQSKQSIDRN
ncbi:hypothetical protein HNR53_000959 [Bacillus benzoevorans]|uniref:Uncharacterized protein n=1 Tax=Bacillus benzoevorans TaxID=1456 RepID=A0A7X0HRR6_9BACI|nr:hypothetical protein [Bacillus benzoevorans]